METNIDPCWLTEAKRHLGLVEIKGVEHAPEILAFWKAVKMGGIKDDETPWCASFAGACFEACGIKSARSGWAKAYLNWGSTLPYPIYGCLGVFSRKGGGGHVGFVVGVDDRERLMVLGGNQNNKVSIAPFNKDRLLCYRWPKQIAIPSNNQPLPMLVSSEQSSNNEA